MPGGKNNIGPEDGKKFSSDYQPEEKWTEDEALQLADNILEWLRQDGNYFFYEYLVIENDYYPNLIDYLCNKFSSFSQRIETAKKIQETKLYKGGFDQMFNASMVKFALINEHGKKSERTENENTHDFPQSIKLNFEGGEGSNDKED